PLQRLSSPESGSMTFVQLHAALREMVPVEVRLHVQMGLQSYWHGRDPAVKRDSDIALQLDIEAWAFLDGDASHVEGATGEEIVERFRAIVLPALGLCPDHQPLKERLRNLDCEFPDP